MTAIVLHLLQAYWKQLGVGAVGGISAWELVWFVVRLFA